MSSRAKTQKRRQDQARQAANRARQAADVEAGTKATPTGAAPPETTAAPAATAATPDTPASTDTSVSTATPVTTDTPVSTATPASTESAATRNRPARSSAATEVKGQPKTPGSACVTAASGQRPAARTTTRPGSGQAPPRRPTGRKTKRARRGPIWAAAAGALIIVVGVVVAIVASSGGGGSTSKFPGTMGPEGVIIPKGPVLASTAKKALGKAVDGIQCQTNEQLVYHVHSHLAVFVNGEPRQIPLGIGIPGDVPQQTGEGLYISTGTCFYWLHTHASDGIIHIESPSNNLTFRLGEFFVEWGQPLTTNQIGPVKGKITAYVNGQLFVGNLQDIPLGYHDVIQIDVGKVVPPQPFKFPSGL